MPVRKIAKSYRNVTGIVAAAKAAGPAQFESTLERDFLTRLEFSPYVRSSRYSRSPCPGTTTDASDATRPTCWCTSRRGTVPNRPRCYAR